MMTGTSGRAALAFALRCGETVGGGNRISLALTTPDDGGIRAAQPCGRFGEGIENGLQVERRVADDLEHVASRGQLPRSRLKLRSQSGLLAARFVELTE